MAAPDFETLRARVQALGCQLFIDDVERGDEPHYYVHDPKIDKHVLVGVPDNEIEDWCVDRETDEQDQRVAPELRAAVQALGELPALLKPYTVNGTKLRIPKEIGDKLTHAHLKPISLAIDSAHYEGVEYDYQSETSDDEPRPAKRNGVQEQYNDALCGLERCQAVARAIQHESDDGDEHAALFAVLYRELDDVDKILEANTQWGGYPPKGQPAR